VCYDLFVLFACLLCVYTHTHVMYVYAHTQVTSVPFFVFYALFAFVLYPNRDKIHPPMPADIDERCVCVLCARIYVHELVYV
jgi:ATP/ADP translocase